jgi:hypothetical protein
VAGQGTYACLHIFKAPAEGNFCNEGGKTIKPHIVKDYNLHMGYVDKGDKMGNSHNSRRTFKWKKKIVLSSVRPGGSK